MQAPQTHAAWKCTEARLCHLPPLPATLTVSFFSHLPMLQQLVFSHTPPTSVQHPAGVQVLHAPGHAQPHGQALMGCRGRRARGV